jgi:hypothetical protein
MPDPKLVEALKRRALEDKRRHRALVEALRERDSLSLRQAANTAGMNAAYSAAEAATAEAEANGADRQERRAAKRRATQIRDGGSAGTVPT